MISATGANVTSFLAVERYSPAMVLALGLLVSIGLMGLGLLLLRILHLKLPSPWRQVTAMLLGLQVLSLTVQLIGIWGWSGPGVLVKVLLVVGALGAVGLAMEWRDVRPFKPGSLAPEFSWFMLAAFVAAGATLLIAMAPSTKIDELYYHMLVPSRIVLDGALRYYVEPWPAAILPQMVFQIAAAPLHALGYPDAANLISWSMSMLLLWFAWRLCRKAGRLSSWTSLWVAALCVGMQAAVQHVTGGSHAMGDLAVAAATVAFFLRKQLAADVGGARFCLLASFLACCAASSKVSLLPLATLTLAFSSAGLFRSADARTKAKLLAALVGPWVVFFLPLSLWTWNQSGSPVGPLLSEVFPTAAQMAAGMDERLASSRDRSWEALWQSAAFYCPLIWLGVAGSLVMSRWDLTTRIAAAALLAIQSLLIVLALPYDIRFLGGLPLGLAIAFAIAPKVSVAEVMIGRAGLAASMTIVVAWLGAELYYASTFARVAVGLEAKADFYERMIALYADYRQLDRILPPNAVLLVYDFRVSAVYAPRPVFMDWRDLPANRPVYLLASTETAIGTLEPVSGYHRRGIVYENRRAATATYRSPGKPPTLEAIQVVRLVKN